MQLMVDIVTIPNLARLHGKVCLTDCRELKE